LFRASVTFSIPLQTIIGAPNPHTDARKSCLESRPDV